MVDCATSSVEIFWKFYGNSLLYKSLKSSEKRGKTKVVDMVCSCGNVIGIAGALVQNRLVQGQGGSKSKGSVADLVRRRGGIGERGERRGTRVLV